MAKKLARTTKQLIARAQLGEDRQDQERLERAEDSRVAQAVEDASLAVAPTPLPIPVPAAVPRIGDVVHFVADPQQHVPAIVMTDGSGPTSALGLFVFFLGRDHFAQTHNRDSFASPVQSLSNISHAGAAQNRLGTWHWPEHRSNPKEVVEAEPV